jgi:hypothetical protein
MLMVTSNSKSYFKTVEASHRTYTKAIRKARTRQGIMNLYWKHKRQHEQLLKKHLRDEMAEINKIKKKIK